MDNITTISIPFAGILVVADKYKLPQKYIRGLEKAPKLPKKKT